jgi:hypothetical protein
VRRCTKYAEEDLSALLDDELPPEVRRTLLEHVARCEACRASMAGWEEDGRALRRVFAGPSAGRGFDQGVMGALVPPTEISLRPPRRRVAVTAAAALLLLAIFLGIDGFRRREEAAPESPAPETAAVTDPIEEYAAGRSDDAEPCLDLLWDRDADPDLRRRAGAALARRARALPPGDPRRRRLGLALVPLIHPDVDRPGREAALGALAALDASAPPLDVEDSREHALRAIRGWYARLR